MKQFWRRFLDLFLRDDLFLRTVLFIAGGALVWGSSFVILELMTDPELRSSVWLAALMWVLVLAFFAWGSVLLCGALAPMRSRIYRAAVRVVPDGYGEEVLVLLVIVFFPAAVLTMLLRLCGLRGSVDPAKLSNQSK